MRKDRLLSVLIVMLILIPFKLLFAETLIYEYDDLNRLKKVTSGSVSIEYIYDEVGNRLQKRQPNQTVNCPAGGSYNPATNRCEAAVTTDYICSLNMNHYSTLNACTSVCTASAACNFAPPPVTLSGSLSDGLGTIQVWLDNELIVNGNYNGGYIDIQGATWSGYIAATYNYEGDVVFLGSGNTISSANGAITVTGATVTGSLIAGSCYYDEWDDEYYCGAGTLTGSGNAIASNYGGSIAFTSTAPGQYVCPLPGGSACDASHNCTTAGACVPNNTCPAGYTLSGNICIANPI